MLTQEETEAINAVVLKCAKMFTRGLWRESYCLAQLEEIANQYNLELEIPFNQFNQFVAELEE